MRWVACSLLVLCASGLWHNEQSVSNLITENIANTVKQSTQNIVNEVANAHIAVVESEFATFQRRRLATPTNAPDENSCNTCKEKDGKIWALGYCYDKTAYDGLLKNYSGMLADLFTECRWGNAAGYKTDCNAPCTARFYTSDSENNEVTMSQFIFQLFADVPLVNAFEILTYYGSDRAKTRLIIQGINGGHSDINKGPPGPSITTIYASFSSSSDGKKSSIKGSVSMLAYDALFFYTKASEPKCLKTGIGTTFENIKLPNVVTTNNGEKGSKKIFTVKLTNDSKNTNKFEISVDLGQGTFKVSGKTLDANALKIDLILKNLQYTSNNPTVDSPGLRMYTIAASFEGSASTDSNGEDAFNFAAVKLSWDKTAQTVGQSTAPVIASGPYEGETCAADWWNPTTQSILATEGMSGLRCFFFCYATGSRQITTVTHDPELTVDTEKAEQGIKNSAATYAYVNVYTIASVALAFYIAK